MNEKSHKKPGSEERMSPSEIFTSARAHLREGDTRAAFRLLQFGIVHYPEQPVLLSYYGCLQALVDKKYRTGVENCKKAILLNKKDVAAGKRDVSAVLYLNLGRAFLAGGKKRDAVEAFQKGLQHDRRNSELLKEMSALGVRKRPAMPFLGRSNPINKYIGMLLHDKKPAAGRRYGVRS